MSRRTLPFAFALWLCAAVVHGQEPAGGTDVDAAARLRDQAIVLAETDRMDEAADAFLEAATLFGNAGDDLERTKCLHNAGAMLEVVGRYEEAVTVFGQALTWSARVRKADYAASSALGRGLALGRLERRAEAIEALDIAVSLLEQLDDQPKLALALYNRGVAEAWLSRDDAAIESFSRAETLYRELGDTLGLSWTTTGLALAYQSDEQPGESHAAFGRALEIARQRGDIEELGTLYNERGIVLRQLNRWEDAMADFDTAEPLLTAAGNAHQLTRQAIYRGESLTSLGRYDEALAAYELADARHPAHDDLLAGYILQGRGDLLTHVGKYGEALQLFARVATIMERHGEHRHLGRIATRQGEASRSLGHFGEALRYNVEAERHYRRDGRTGYIAGALLDRAELYAELGRVDEALAAYDESQALFEDIHDREWVALVDVSRSTTLRKTGRTEEALAALDRAWPELHAIGNPRQLAPLRFDRALLLTALDRPKEGMAELDAAREDYILMGGQGAVAQEALARASAHRSLGHVSRAFAGYDRAEAILEELGLAHHLLRVAVRRGSLLAEQGRHAEAVQQYGIAAGRLEELLAGHVASLGERSSSSLRAEFAAVVPAVLDSVMVLAAARADAMPPTTDDLLSAWHVMEVFQGLGMAQLVAERRVLADDTLPVRLAIALEAARQDVSAAAEQLVELQDSGAPTDDVPVIDVERVAAARATLDTRRRALQQLQDEARLAAPHTALPPIAPMNKVRRSLGADEALVHYSALGDEVHALVVTRAGAQLLPLGPTAHVESAVAAVSQRLAPRHRREQPVPLELSTDLRALGRLLLDPVLRTVDVALAKGADAEEDGRLRQLIVVPSASLCHVPFEALLIADVAPGTDRAEWPYLAADVAVAYVHSGTTWLTLRQRAEERGARERPDGPQTDAPTYVAFAHPTYAAPRADDDTPDVLGLGFAPEPHEPRESRRGGTSWAPLPRTADEVLAVARLLTRDAEDDALLDQLADQLLDGPVDEQAPVAGKDFLLLLRTQATEARLKQQPEVATARILHLACHGAADTRSPALSRLVLGQPATGGATGEDGLLFVDELAQLDLSCDLLVLSACETNVGPVAALEGVDGLCRAGLAAGSQAVLATLWQVQDEGARRLIVSFHKGWLDEGRSRIAALGRARRQAIAQGVPISTWAAFQLWDGVTGD